MSVTSPNGLRPWRFALASAIGSSHVRSGTPCQDASACEVFSPAGASTFIGLVSDGAGSAPLSQVGARMACQIWREEACAALAGGAGVNSLDASFAHATLARFQVTLARLARRASRPVRDFACTLLFAAVDEHASAFAQIGDGAIVVADREKTGRENTDQVGSEQAASDRGSIEPGDPAPPTSYSWVFWPQQGEYVNQTHFATEVRAAEQLAFELRPGRIDELALFSDGIQGLVLDSRKKVAHARFFEPMFAAVRWAGPGRSDGLCRSLERYLRSRTVESRTDDDKSLILASRRAPEPRAVLPLAASGASMHPAARAPLAVQLPRELRD